MLLNKFQNFNNFEQQPQNFMQQGNMNQIDMFAGFNFNLANQNMAHNVEEQKPAQIPDAWSSPQTSKEQKQQEQQQQQEEQQEALVLPDDNDNQEYLELADVQPEPNQPENIRPVVNALIAQVPEVSSPLSLDNVLAEHAFKGLVVEPESKPTENIDNRENEQIGSQQDLSQQESSRTSRRPLGNAKERTNRAAMLAREQARRQQKEAGSLMQGNGNVLVNTDSFDTTLSLARDNMQGNAQFEQNLNVIKPQKVIEDKNIPGANNLEQIPDMIELPEETENLSGQNKTDLGFKSLVMGSKKGSSIPTKLEGDIDQELHYSPLSEEQWSPEKSMQNRGKDQLSVKSPPDNNERAKLGFDDKEEAKGENPQVQQGEFTIDALYGSAGNRNMNSGINNDGKGKAVVPQNEWDNLFDMQHNSDIQKVTNLQQQQQNYNTGNFSFSDQEITPNHLKQFIQHEASKNMADWIIDYSQLKFKEQIGAGGSAQVYKGVWRGTEVAIKKISLDQLAENRKREFEREIAALMKLRPHQNLVNFMGVSLNGNELCIITEFCSGGTLFEWLHMKKYFLLNWQQKIKMAVDIACGMNYLHTCSPPIIHRDLKSLNLLLDGPVEDESQRFTIKLADFGLAKAEDQSQEMKTGLMGTFHWMAPEIFDNKVYTVKADVYSFGIVLYEIITRETPYQELQTPIQIMRYVSVEKQRPNLANVPVDCPRSLVEIMKKCWAHEPQDRPDFTEILEKLKFLKL